MVKKSLEQHQIEHELQVVRDGAKALALVARMGPGGGIPCPNVVLVDLNLPKVDGAEVLAALRRHPACAQTPVVVITSSDADKDRRRMAQLGVNRLLQEAVFL